MSIPAKVNPKILEWARLSSGYTLQEVAKRINQNEEIIKEAEEVKRQITIPQLRNLAEMYKRPMAIFYLQNIPKEFEVPDFRTISNKDIFGYSNSNIKLVLREIYQKKKNAEELSIDNFNDNLYSNYINKFTIKDNPEECAKFLRQILNVDHSDYKKLRDHDVLNYWKDKVENLGILVFQFQDIDPILLRGFVFSNTPYPTIAINQKENSFYSRCFTIIHELCHIILNKTGICDPQFSIKNYFHEKDETEIFCDRVSSYVFVLNKDFHEFMNKFSFDIKQINKITDEFCNLYKVSHSFFFYRLYIEKLISKDFFNEKIKLFQDNYNSRNITSANHGGGSYYTLFLSSTSRNYLNLVLSNLEKQNITYFKALQYLGLKMKSFDKVREILEMKK